jgi:hypothetical protein
LKVYTRLDDFISSAEFSAEDIERGMMEQEDKFDFKLQLDVRRRVKRIMKE